MLRYLEIKNQLLEITDKMQPGEKLMNRNTLCKMLDTTRTTLDKAIRELVDQGVLVSRKGSGTFLSGGLITPQKGIKNWCVIVPNFEIIYARLVSGIESVARQHDVNVILCCSDDNFSRQEHLIHRLIASGADGFIIVPVITDSPQDNLKLYSQLVNMTIPFVFCNRGIEGINVPVVSSNDFYGSYIATKLLIDRGYRRIGFVAPRKYVTSIQRCHGYMSALQEAGIQIDRRLIFFPPTATAGDYIEPVKRMIEKEKADGFYCFNYAVGVDVADTVEKCGKRVSDDIGIIAYSNGGPSDIGRASLSTVGAKASEIGAKAAQVLGRIISGDEPKSAFDGYLFMPEITERQSCKGKTINK
ncbi:MAG: substrate-binding domain-containing protein [Clostridia bacterium]|nr:substrate-binding domain-containing protein [Clostridia bacterium]